MSKPLAVIVSVVGSAVFAEEAVEYVKAHSDPELTDVIILDNGSYTPVPQFQADDLIRHEKNTGGNAYIHSTIPYLEERGYEYVAHIHCDFIICEAGWDRRVLDEFEKNANLALIGFVGSSEMDANGGRGGGTALNFQGGLYRWGQAAPASAHGKQIDLLMAGAVVDHCSMIFRISMLKTLTPAEAIHTPGHFYDRIISCEVLHKGYHLGVMGIACDHRSGGIAYGVQECHDLYVEWLEANGIPYDPDRVDLAIYQEGERRFLNTWRDHHKFLPVRVLADHTVQVCHPDTMNFSPPA